MKVLFTDIDGVLNSDGYVRRHGGVGVVIDPTRLALLQGLIRETGAVIVLSSSWREHWEPQGGGDDVGRQLDELFAAYGLSIAGKTPKRPDGREQEIRAWLAAHPEVTHFAVLDDRFLEADFLKEHLVLTSRLRNGLDEEDVRRAAAILNEVTV